MLGCVAEHGFSVVKRQYFFGYITGAHCLFTDIDIIQVVDQLGGIGKISFELDAIRGNLEAVLADLKKAKPAASKGIYLKKVTLSTTMGPGVTIDQGSIEV